MEVWLILFIGLTTDIVNMNGPHIVKLLYYSTSRKMQFSNNNLDYSKTLKLFIPCFIEFTPNTK